MWYLSLFKQYTDIFVCMRNIKVSPRVQKTVNSHEEMNPKVLLFYSYKKVQTFSISVKFDVS